LSQGGLAVSDALPFVRYFADLPDPRVDRTKRRRLDDILVVTRCAAVCGADSFEEIERFGKSRRAWLKGFLALPNVIPSHDTFNRVLAALDRKKYAEGFARWMNDLCTRTGRRSIAIDGKACRAAAADTFSGCLHLVSAWAASVEEGRGRREERHVTVLPNPQGLPPEWEGVSAAAMVGREREADGRTTSTAHYYLTSLRGSARKLAECVRGHWGVENGLHWCLDVSFNEDGNRTRDRNAGANLGVVRRVAASLLKQDRGRGSIKAKRFGAALDTKYQERILHGFADD
jgi:predicted transposase YbfD/YdcC